jgi:hypothetical protein
MRIVTVTDPITAALLTLLVSAASYSDPNQAPSDRRYIVWPGAAALPAREAAELLAGLAKPVRCHPEKDGLAVSLHCTSEPTPTTAFEKVAAANHRAARLALLGPLPDWANDAAGRALVVVRGDADRLIVPLSTLREWRSDYIIVQDHSIMFTDDGDGHRVAGTFTVIGNIDMLREGHFRHG